MQVPAAEGAFIHLLKERGVFEQFYVDSRERLLTMKVRKLILACGRPAKRGIPLPSWSRQVTPEDFEEFDLILAMDRKNFSDLRRICPDDSRLSKLKLFTDFKQKMTHQEVPDPYYGGEKGFEEVMDLVLDCSYGLLQYLKVR